MFEMLSSVKKHIREEVSDLPPIFGGLVALMVYAVFCILAILPGIFTFGVISWALSDKSSNESPEAED